ncbi:MAG: RsmB/NOP family class I SAM-dependent RNA methyltransferase [Clostridiales bacterium]|nr:RsmB/NOP family class I SAM-dependent RNA methyltransferase [Clostridiales bacterium]
MRFPKDFETRMRQMLGSEYDDFAAGWESAPEYRGIRINMLKKGADAAVKVCTGSLEPVSWCKNGFYIDKSMLSGKSPYHMCGLVYFQEPSAMSAVEALGIEENDFVLDLCAAPGGKACQAAERLGEGGLLVANEIVPKRAKILAENIGRMGIRNAVVTNESPERLAEKYEAFFDKIIVDAPCSGEGMFKKEPQASDEWSLEHTYSCAERQKKIISSAFKMLKKGGRLIYSTCTFAPCENEGVTAWVLDSYPEAELLEINLPGMSCARGEWAGTNRNLTAAKRIFPHISKGEGHYNALFRKNEGTSRSCIKEYKCGNEEIFRSFEKDFLNTDLRGEFISFGDKLYLLPHKIDIDKIRVELAGLFLGICKKGRFEPSHELCLALCPDDFKNVQDISEPERYYHGETLPSREKGWTAVIYNGYPIGWGKASEGMLKNHFPKYLRF